MKQLSAAAAGLAMEKSGEATSYLKETALPEIARGAAPASGGAVAALIVLLRFFFSPEH